jgi:hypothetical protein
MGLTRWASQQRPERRHIGCTAALREYRQQRTEHRHIGATVEVSAATLAAQLRRPFTGRGIPSLPPRVSEAAAHWLHGRAP